MRALNFNIRLLLAAMTIVMALPGCKPKTKVLKSPPHYNFATAYSMKLEDKIVEVSGIAWDSKANYFIAINDESDKIYYLDKENKLIKEEYTFADKGDYEDVAIFHGTPYILKSDGTIFRFFKDSTGKVAGQDLGNIGLAGTNDFETMYADPARNALVVICKNCKQDDENSVSAFAFYPDSIGFDPKPIYKLDAKKIRELSPVKSSKFQPSGAAIHPILQKLFILSSASHQLAIADLNGNVESVYRLSPKTFPQPEGITFHNDGDMYITNEGLPGKKRSTLVNIVYIPVSDSAKVVIGKSGYNFVTPDARMELGKHLREISGMAYVPGREMILAENDEKGNIFMLDFKAKKDNEGKIPFGGKDDYEDIVYTDTAIYMLVATGKIIKVKTQLNQQDTSVVTEEFVLPKEGVNEFEAMYMDADGKSLILLCKDCDKEKNKIRMAHRFNLATETFDPSPAYTIQISEIQALLHDDKAEFKPSAAGINPANGKLYIVASVGKVMVIADRNGKVEQAIPLDPVMYNQPEGITFAPNGDMYVSNEAGTSVATILKFVYKKQ